ncbi:hypothetical protein LTR97_005866 [Elasticomyces elasticus]|uniref:Uncharacterized protein n=1 Tax=Elasticomyces elasticus TaxID=574655 RepID=A0AAN7W425_9PEZI|nr:hypothetical protein LTR97_005866 [Elasticomyces elasticus]
MAVRWAKQDAKVTCQRSATEPIDSKITTVAFDLPYGPHNLNVPRIVLTAADAKDEARTNQNFFSKAQQQIRRDSLDGLSYVTCPRLTKPKPLRQRLLMWIPEHCSLKKRDGSRGKSKDSGVRHDGKL